jgi:hypothetical protein
VQARVRRVLGDLRVLHLVTGIFASPISHTHITTSWNSRVLESRAPGYRGRVVFVDFCQREGGTGSGVSGVTARLAATSEISSSLRPESLTSVSGASLSSARGESSRTSHSVQRCHSPWAPGSPKGS